MTIVRSVPRMVIVFATLSSVSGPAVFGAIGSQTVNRLPVGTTSLPFEAVPAAPTGLLFVGVAPSKK